MNHQVIDNNEGFEETAILGYESDNTMPDNPDDTEETPILNEQGEDVVNGQDFNHINETDATETEPVATPEPGDDSPPPEIEIDPTTPVVEQPTMSS